MRVIVIMEIEDSRPLPWIVTAAVIVPGVVIFRPASRQWPEQGQRGYQSNCLARCMFECQCRKDNEWTEY